MRQAVVCLLLVAVCFDQAPGDTVADTKLDLVLAPWRFLGRALHMWDPQTAAGVVQNQANGYLWPMGPFFGVLHTIGLPAWVVQRSWWSLITVLAFLGTVRLARALGSGTDVTRLIAGVAFALSPRMLGSLGPISVEVLPLALSPWVVLPLVGAGGTRSLRRAATLSALAVLCIGGVNAAATLGGVLPAMLFVLVGPVVGSRVRLAAWWSLAVFLATAWWVVPLLLLSRYAAVFLPYTETASATTSVTSAVQVLRGTSHWVTYLYGPDGPARPAGWQLLTSGWVVLASGLVVAAGLAGVARRRTPGRAWMVASLLVGVLLVSAGHVGTLDSPLSGALRDALDGPLSPLRNVHKFDPLVRLPVMLGLAEALAAVRWRRDAALTPALRTLAAAGASLAVLVAALPAVAGHVPAARAWSRVPPQWSQVARLLAQDAPAGRALLLPGSPFAQYEWGDPQDEPLHALSESPWEVRDASPLVPAGHIRLLDAIDQQLRSGRPSSALAPVLARSGISHVVVRNDLRASTQAVPPEVVRQVLRDSPGFTLVRSLGRPAAGAPAGARAPIELYRVNEAVLAATSTPLSDVTLLSGGPESLLPALEDGLVGAGPTVLAAQLPAGFRAGPTVLTDGLQRREEDFASARHLSSPVLGPHEPLVFDRAAREFTLGTARDETVAELLGAKAVRASSSLADPDAGESWSPSHFAYAAVDGDPTTSWTSGRRPQGAVGQWIELDLGRSVDAASFHVVWGDGAIARRVRIDTDGGSTRKLVAGRGTEDLPVPKGRLRRLRITVEAVDRAAAAGPVSIKELDIPGVRVTRALDVPPLRATAAPDAVQLHASRVGQDACVTTDTGARCDPATSVHGEEDGGLIRRIDVGAGGTYDPALVAVPRAGPGLDALLNAQNPLVRVLGTTSAVDEPLGAPAAAVDGDTGTGWVASPNDSAPGLVLGWLRPLRVDSLRLVVADSLHAARATRVRVRAGLASYEADVAADGTARFPAVTTTQLAVDLLAPRQPTPGSRNGVGVSELVVPGLQGLAVPAPTNPVALPCGSTPSLVFPDRTVSTSGSTTVEDLRALRPVRLEPCGDGAVPLRLTGVVRLLAVSTPAWRVDRIDLRQPGARTPDSTTQVQRLSWGDEHRRLSLPSRTASVLLTVRENANSGWSARVGGRALPSVPVDGWQQGWVVPPGGPAVVDLRYRPGAVYRAALGGGSAGVLCLLALAVLPSRTTSPLRRRRRSPGRAAAAAGTAGAAVALALLAGVAGVIAWGVALLGLVVAGRRRPAASAWLAGAAYALAVALLALHPWGRAGYAGGSGVVTALCLLALAAATTVLPARGDADASPVAPAADDSPPHTPTPQLW